MGGGRTDETRNYRKALGMGIESSYTMHLLSWDFRVTL